MRGCLGSGNDDMQEPWVVDFVLKFTWLLSKMTWHKKSTLILGYNFAWNKMEEKQPWSLNLKK